LEVGGERQTTVDEGRKIRRQNVKRKEQGAKAKGTRISVESFIILI